MRRHPRAAPLLLRPSRRRRRSPDPRLPGPPPLRPEIPVVSAPPSAGPAASGEARESPTLGSHIRDVRSSTRTRTRVRRSLPRLAAGLGAAAVLAAAVYGALRGSSLLLGRPTSEAPSLPSAASAISPTPRVESSGAARSRAAVGYGARSSLGSPRCALGNGGAGRTGRGRPVASPVIIVRVSRGTAPHHGPACGYAGIPRVLAPARVQGSWGSGCRSRCARGPEQARRHAGAG